MESVERLCSFDFCFATAWMMDMFEDYNSVYDLWSVCASFKHILIAPALYKLEEQNLEIRRIPFSLFKLYFSFRFLHTCLCGLWKI